MSTPDAHRELRELLGVYALAALPPGEVGRVQAHLDGCAACRGELAEIAPLADDLRGVDVARLRELPVPPPGFGARLRAQVAEERVLVEARQRRQAATRSTRRVLAGAAAAALVLAAVGVGAVVGRSTAPDVLASPGATPTSSPAPVVPMEVLAVQGASGVSASTAVVIAHAWGVEARFEGTGFRAGEVYRAAFRSADGRALPAGQFLGTGEGVLKCNLQAALPRGQAQGFTVVDAAGAVVLSARL